MTLLLLQQLKICVKSILFRMTTEYFYSYIFRKGKPDILEVTEWTFIQMVLDVTQH